MKQKIVIRFSSCDKSRSKVMKIAVGVGGVDSVALGGQDKTQIEVVGDGVDAVQLTTRLRKRVGYSEIVSVSAVKEEKEEKKPEEPKIQELVPSVYYPAPPPLYYHQYPDEPACSIM